MKSLFASNNDDLNKGGGRVKGISETKMKERDENLSMKKSICIVDEELDLL
jgi:hypothetical protein